MEYKVILANYNQIDSPDAMWRLPNGNKKRVPLSLCILYYKNSLSRLLIYNKQLEKLTLFTVILMIYQVRIILLAKSRVLSFTVLKQIHCTVAKYDTQHFDFRDLWLSSGVLTKLISIPTNK